MTTINNPKFQADIPTKYGWYCIRYFDGKFIYAKLIMGMSGVGTAVPYVWKIPVNSYKKPLAYPLEREPDSWDYRGWKSFNNAASERPLYFYLGVDDYETSN